MIFKNILSMSFVNFFSAIVNIVSMPIIIGGLGAKVYGVYALVFIQCQLLTLIVNFSFDLYAIKHIKYIKKADESKFLFEIILARGILFLLFGALFLTYLSLTNTTYPHINWILVLAVMPSCFSLVWYFQVKDKMSKLALCTFIGKTFYLSAIFLGENEPIEFFAIVFLLANIVTIILSWWFMHGEVVRFEVPSLKKAIWLIKDSKSIFMFQVTVGALPSINSNLAFYFGGPLLVTVFDLFNKVSSTLNLLFISITQAIYPKLVDKEIQYLKLVITIYTLGSLFFLVISLILIGVLDDYINSFVGSFLNAEFELVTYIISLASVFVFFCSLNTIFSRVLLIMNKVRIINYSTLLALLSSIIITPVIVFNFQYFGVFIGMVIAQLLMSICLFRYIYILGHRK